MHSELNYKECHFEQDYLKCHSEHIFSLAEYVQNDIDTFAMAYKIGA